MPKVMVVYHSQEYGNTAQMAAAVAQGAQNAGVEVEQVNTNETRVDVDAYRAADAVAFGSPDYFSYIAGGLKTFLDDWYIAKKTSADGLTRKPYGLFYSHGGGGSVIKPLEKLFDRMGTKVGTTIGSSGRPTEDVLAACRGLGEALARTC